MIGTEACGPVRKALGNGGAHAAPALEFDGVPLAVVEADRLHAGVALQSVAQAGRGILAAGEQDQSAGRFCCGG